MHRLYILLTELVVMVGAFFAGYEGVAKLLTGGNDDLVGTNEADHLWGGRGDDKIRPGKGNDKVVAGAGDDLVYAREPPWRGLHRLRDLLRPGRDHTPRR